MSFNIGDRVQYIGRQRSFDWKLGTVIHAFSSVCLVSWDNFYKGHNGSNYLTYTIPFPNASCWHVNIDNITFIEESPDSNIKHYRVLQKMKHIQAKRKELGYAF
jgi:hypothetical protein